MLELGVLISGRGSNLRRILEAIDAGALDARVRLVIASKPRAAGLEVAASHGVPATTVSPRAFATREQFDEALAGAMVEAGAEWIVLAGFMRVLGPAFLRHYPWRVVNIHPSLLPAFPGVEAAAQALAHGVRVTGCTVHLVDEGVDSGPILAQAVVPVLADDTAESLSQRILVREHQLLPAVLQWVAEERVLLVPTGARPRVVVQGRVPWLGLADAEGTGTGLR